MAGLPETPFTSAAAGEPRSPGTPGIPKRIRWIAAGIIGAGIMVRLAGWLSDVPLWYDELLQAEAILDRHVGEMFEPIIPSAPAGWMIAVKLAVTAFGRSGYALRLVPLASGSAALVMAYFVGARYLKPRALPIALGIMAFSPHMIRYSCEAKQYASDATVALVILLVAERFYPRKITLRRAVAMALVGAGAVWISYPAVFVLAGMGSALAVDAVRRNDWRKAGAVAASAACWLVSFGAYFLIILREQAKLPILQEFWQWGFMPLPPKSLHDLGWFSYNARRFFEHPLGASIPAVAGIAFAVGLVVIARRRPAAAIALAGPMLLALVASGFGRYPFSERLLLFLVPAVAIIAADGIGWAASKAGRYRAIPTVIVVAAIGYGPLLQVPGLVASPVPMEDSRASVAHLKSRAREGDTVYVYYAARPGYEYYSRMLAPPRLHAVVGGRSRDDPTRYAPELEALAGRPRVWAIFSHLYGSERRYILHHLDGAGRRLDELMADGASVHLYDLSAAPPPGPADGPAP